MRTGVMVDNTEIAALRNGKDVSTQAAMDYGMDVIE